MNYVRSYQLKNRLSLASVIIAIFEFLEKRGW